MKRPFLLLVSSLCVLVSAAEEAPVVLPVIEANSPRVAMQEPVSSFDTPVSVLRYEPLLDLQARNFGEAQADITIRGGIFENTGFRVGGVSLYDPQTGHYFGEIPVAPAMLGAPDVLTGTANALAGFNADVGTVAYAWRPITTRGEAKVGFGDYGLEKQSFYQGFVSPVRFAGQTLAVDAEYAHSRGDGTIPFGDHRFWRANTRIQLKGDDSQTDLFYGYQTKFFGWPDLYTPFGVHETENLQTNLLMLNHRQELGDGDYAELGAFYRRNKDDYEFSRETPGLYNPYQHTTWARAVSLSGRSRVGEFAIDYSSELLSDNLESTSLVFGPYNSRTYFKAGVLPSRSWALDQNQKLSVKAGLTYDDTNRDGSAVSPQFELALADAAKQDRWYFSYAKATQVPTYTALKSSPTGGLFRGNADLGRESAHNLELGYEASAGAWSWRAAAFYRFDRGLVDWTYSYSSTAARTADPVDIDTVGFEAMATYDHAWLRVVLGYTWLDKNANYRGAAVDASFYALNFAKHRLTAAIVARLGGGFEVRMDNVARIQENNPLRTVGGDEALISSLGLYYLPKAVPGLQLSVAADNLWNSNFEEIPAVPAPRRQLSAQVTYGW